MKTRNVVLYAILLIASMVLLAGCASGSELQTQDKAQELVAVETEEVDVEAVGETENIVLAETEEPVASEPEEIFFQQSSRLDAYGVGIEGTTETLIYYPYESAYCLKQGESYRIAIKEPGSDEVIMDYHPSRYIMAINSNRDISAQLQIVKINDPGDRDDDVVVNTSDDWVDFTYPAPENEPYSGGIENSVSLSIDTTVQLKLLEEGPEGPRIAFRLNWQICLEPYSDVQFYYRELNSGDAIGWWPIFTNEFTVPVTEGVVYEGGIGIFNMTTGEYLEIDWIELPTLDDLQ